MGHRSRLDWPITICVAACSAIAGFGIWFATDAHDQIAHIEDASLVDCVDTVTATHQRSGLDECGDPGPSDISLIRAAMTPPGR